MDVPRHYEVKVSLHPVKQIALPFMATVIYNGVVWSVVINKDERGVNATFPFLNERIPSGVTLHVLEGPNPVGKLCIVREHDRSSS